MTDLQVFDAVAELIAELAADPETHWSFGSHKKPNGMTHALEEIFEG
jgi:hypothetical protein